VTLCDELNTAEFGTDHKPTIDDFSDEIPSQVIVRHLSKLQLSFFGKAKGVLNVLSTLWHNAATLKNGLKECDTHRTWCQSMWMDGKLSTDPQALKQHWEALEQRFVKIGSQYIELTVHQMILAQIVKSGTASFPWEKAAELVTTVLSGIGGSPVAAIATEIESLAKSVAKKKTFVKYFAGA